MNDFSKKLPTLEETRDALDVILSNQLVTKWFGEWLSRTSFSPPRVEPVRDALRRHGLKVTESGDEIDRLCRGASPPEEESSRKWELRKEPYLIGSASIDGAEPVYRSRLECPNCESAVRRTDEHFDHGSVSGGEIIEPGYFCDPVLCQRDNLSEWNMPEPLRHAAWVAVHELRVAQADAEERTGKESGIAFRSAADALATAIRANPRRQKNGRGGTL